jgi:hypothetical protein
LQNNCHKAQGQIVGTTEAVQRTGLKEDNRRKKRSQPGPKIKPMLNQGTFCFVDLSISPLGGKRWRYGATAGKRINNMKIKTKTGSCNN